MDQVRARRKERIMIPRLIVLSITCALLVTTVRADGKWGRCMDSTKTVPPRLSGSNTDLILEMSSRISHQLLTHIYRILVEEELGYTQVEIIERNDFDLNETMNRMSCFDNSHGLIDIIPTSFINLEVPAPPDYRTTAFFDICVHDLGAISPTGYFGWFIPGDFAQKMASIKSKHGGYKLQEVHWSSFQDKSFTKYLNINEKKYIEQYTHEIIDGKKSYYCEHPNCKEGWYKPKQCSDSADSCAVLLAADYNDTKVIIDHIENMSLYIKVVWLGPNLAHVSENLTKVYRKVQDKSFMIISWTPSDVILNPADYIVVRMMRCDSMDPSEPGCFYEKRRMSKFAWKDLSVDSRQDAYNLLKGMNFLDIKNYNSLLQSYDLLKSNSTLSDIACHWVNNNRQIWRFWKGNEQEEEVKIYIGGIFPISGSTYTGRGIVKGASMAVDAVNNNDNVMKGYRLELKVADGQCRADKVMKAFIDYLTNNLYNSLVGVLGPACSETVEPLAGISKYYKTITISYSAEGAVFSDQDKYPYFIRTIGENRNYKFVYLELLKKLGWKRVAALTEDGQKYTEYISHMKDLLESNDIKFIENIKFPRHRQKDPMTRYLKDLKSKRAHIIIADVFDEIARNVMCEAYKLEMTAKQGYVWFLPTWLNSTWYDTTYYNQHMNESINCTTAMMIEAINGYFAMTHAYFANDDDLMQENITVAQWRQTYKNESQLKKIPQSSYAGYAYDAVWTYAYALDELIKKNPEAMFNLHSTNTTNKLTQIIKSSDFNGVSGKIKFRGGTTRFSVINLMQWYNNKTIMIGRFHPNISDTAPEIMGGKLELNKSAIHWLQNNKIPDDGTPLPNECTLNALAKLLDVECETAIIVLNLVVSIIVIVALGTAIFIIKKRYDKKVENTEKYMKSLGLNHLLATDYTGLDKWEIDRDSVVLNRKLGEGAFGTVYGGEANLPNGLGWTGVAVKTLKVGSTTEEKLDFLSEAEVMKRFDHKNIVKLLGVCTKIEPVYTIMEFMLYGDLKTYLLGRRHLVNDFENDEVSSKKLTSMALDVARGLSYLAEMNYVHRDVASRNCLLNEQRVVKLGDFGMTRPTSDNGYYKFNRRGMLPVRWMAPESLALGVFSPKSDIWSYGVLLYEIITFGSFPFQGLSNSQVLDYVKNGHTLSIPQGVKAPLECLLKNCWESNPSTRPSACELVDYLANNSRLISPCLDIPIASVQMEDTGQLDMQLPDQFRKCSSSLSFKNLPLVNGISQMSIHTPTRRQQSVPSDSGVLIPMENCCPKEPLLPPRSDSIGGCSKYATLQHMAGEPVCDQEDNDDYFPSPIINGHAISKV